MAFHIGIYKNRESLDASTRRASLKYHRNDPVRLQRKYDNIGGFVAFFSRIFKSLFILFLLCCCYMRHTAR